MARKVIGVVVFLLLAVGVWKGYTSSASSAEHPQVGRYRFVPTGGSVGYRFDTATGELRQVFVGSEKLIWEGIEGASVIGRFEVIPRHSCNCSSLGVSTNPPTWYLVDTATGNIWQITPAGVVYVGDPNRQ